MTVLLWSKEDYLGITIENIKNIFHKYKLNILEKEKRVENQTWNNRKFM